MEDITMNAPEIFDTTNIRLENFMHLHRVPFFDQRKTRDGMNQWLYYVTPRFEEVLAEYMHIYGNQKG